MTRFDDSERELASLPASDPQARVIRVMLAMDRHQEEKAKELLNSGPVDDPRLAQLKGRLALSVVTARPRSAASASPTPACPTIATPSSG